jgi:hypothetical protein
VLFNVCLEPLLRELARRKEELGCEIDFGDPKFYVNALPHADHLILIMDVNAKICCIIPSRTDQADGRWKAMLRQVQHASEALPQLEHE